MLDLCNEMSLTSYVHAKIKNLVILVVLARLSSEWAFSKCPCFVTWFLPEAHLSHNSLLKTSAQCRFYGLTAQCVSDTQQMLQVTSKEAKPCLSSGRWARTDVSRGSQCAVCSGRESVS